MKEDKKVEKQIQDTYNWESVARGSDNVFVNMTEAMVEAIPEIGVLFAAGNEAYKKAISHALTQSRKNLIECLKNSSATFTLESVSKEDFIINFSNLYQAVIRLRSNEKVQLMTNLFASAHFGKALCDLDEYDEMIERLNRLSLREIKILQLLHVQKDGITNNGFYEQIKEEYGMEKEIVNNILSSMTQSGFCKEKVGTYTGYTGNIYYTTDLFSRFLKLIHIDDNVCEKEKEQRHKHREEDVLNIEDVINEDIDNSIDLLF